MSRRHFIQKVVGIFLSVVGILLILNSVSGITGFVIAEPIEKGLSSVIGLAFVVIGVVFVRKKKVKKGYEY